MSNKMNLLQTQKLTQNVSKNVNVRVKTIQLRRKHKGNLYDIGLGKEFLYMTPKA